MKDERTFSQLSDEERRDRLREIMRKRLERGARAVTEPIVFDGFSIPKFISDHGAEVFDHSKPSVALDVLTDFMAKTSDADFLQEKFRSVLPEEPSN